MTFLATLHPERNIDNFTRLDGTIMFFSFVKAAMMRVGAKKVMDFGAGRGSVFYEDSGAGGSLFKRALMDLRSDGAEVWACDVDEVVRTHPASHHQVVISPGGALPFEDAMFDLIVSEVVFEHIAQPEPVVRELLRVLRPGGYICARTPNKTSYAALATRMVPNRYHARALTKISPTKQAQDVFPTVFKMNTVKDVKRLFAGCDVYWYRNSAEPSYYFGNRLLYRAFSAVHKLLPNALENSLCVFVRKPD